MPALEVLDLSRNRIRSFPEKPGFLSNLRVCWSREKLHGVLTYLPPTGFLFVKEQDLRPPDLSCAVSKSADLQSGTESIRIPTNVSYGSKG